MVDATVVNAVIAVVVAVVVTVVVTAVVTVVVTVVIVTVVREYPLHCSFTIGATVCVVLIAYLNYCIWAPL